MARGKHAKAKRSPAAAEPSSTSTPTRAEQAGGEQPVPSSPWTAASASALPSSPAVLTPASLKSLIPTRHDDTLSTPFKQPPSSTQQSDSPAVMHSGQVKRAIEQLSGSSSGSGSGSGSGSSSVQSSATAKRPSISAHIPSGTVAQRVADYSAAVFASGPPQSSATPTVPPASSAVAELISHFSTREPTANDIQHTQHKWTPAQSADTRPRSEAQPSVGSPMTEQTEAAKVEVGHAHFTTADGNTGSLLSYLSLSSNTSPQPATGQLLSTPDVPPHSSTVVESGTATAAPQHSKRSKKQSKADRATRVEPPVEHATLSTPRGAQLLSSHHALVDPQTSSESVASLPRSGHFVTRIVRHVWHICMWTVWAALVPCAGELLLRDPNWESVTLCGLAVLGAVDSSLRIVRPVHPATSSDHVSHGALRGLTAIAAAALPFLFAQRLARLFCLHPGLLLLCLSLPLCCLTLLALCRGGSAARGGSAGLLSSVSAHFRSAACLLCFAFSLALLQSSAMSFAPPYSTPWTPLPSQPASHVKLIVLLQAVSVLSWLLTADSSQLGWCMSVLSLLMTEQHLRLPPRDSSHC